MPFNFSGRESDHIVELRYSRYLSTNKPVTGIIMIRKKIDIMHLSAGFKKEAGRPFKISVE